MAYEAPTAGTGQSVLEHEYRGDGVLGIVEMGAVGAIAMRTGDYSEYLLKDVQLVRRKVIEVAASGNIAAGAMAAVPVRNSQGHGEERRTLSAR